MMGSIKTESVIALLIDQLTSALISSPPSILHPAHEIQLQATCGHRNQPFCQ
jgi:hypothetical protein